MEIPKTGHSKTQERRGAKRLYITLIIAVLISYIVVAVVGNGQTDNNPNKDPQSAPVTQPQRGQ